MMLTTSMKKNALFSLFIFGIILSFIGSGCTLNTCFPTAPAYPEPGWDFNKIVNDAKQISDDLDAYVKQYLDGNVCGNLPMSLEPDGQNPNQVAPGSWYVVSVNPDTQDFNKFNICDYAHPVDHNQIHPWFRDNHATYILPHMGWAPFGHKLIIKGQFPHTRFFDIQVNPPFNPYVYEYLGGTGEPEVSIVDVDIEPDAGHVNIFRNGSDHFATNRNYTVTYELKMGNSADFDANVCPKPPYYRGNGNKRYGSLIAYSGPWGDPNGPTMQYGRWDAAGMWIRYYGPDNGKPYGDAFPVKTWYEDSNGRKWWMLADFSKKANEGKGGAKDPCSAYAEPNLGKPFTGPKWGWNHEVDIFLAIGEGMSLAYGLWDADQKKYIRDVTLGCLGRGDSQPGPGGYSESLSCVNYYALLLHGMSVGQGKVFVLTGKLPTYPDTRGGAGFNNAEMRYWSLNTYEQRGADANIGLTSTGYDYTSILDDEIVLDSNRRYVIVYSTPADKPTNAISANGVTWADMGCSPSTQGITLRWVSVYPDHYFSLTPDSSRIPWAKTTWSAAAFDQNIIGANRHDHLLKWYLPKSHYMSKAQFEELSKYGTRVEPQTVRVWNDNDDPNHWTWGEPKGWTTISTQTFKTGGTDYVNLSTTQARFIRMKGITASSIYGYNLISFKVWDKDTGGTNIALNKPAWASSQSSSSEAYATDNDDVWTWWASGTTYADEWIYVDLGSKQTIEGITFLWGWYYPTSYVIQVADELY